MVSKYKSKFSALQADLDERISIMTMHALSPSTLLLRLAHRYAITDDVNLSTDVTLDLASLFLSISITNCTEMTLTGNIPLVNVPKTTYTVSGGNSVILPNVPSSPIGPITLKAMDIRTFQCELKLN